MKIIPMSFFSFDQNAPNIRVEDVVAESSMAPFQLSFFT